MPVTQQSRRVVRSAKRLSCLFTLIFLALLSLLLADRFGSDQFRERTSPALRYLNLDHSKATIEQLALMLFGGALLWGVGEIVWRYNK